jgi:hypothetical protein
MFCASCGKEILGEGKFCPSCGKAVDGTPNAVNTASDPAKILKQGEFRRFEKFMDAMSKKNDGKLSLFCDRVEWRGKVNDDIKIDDIVEVAVVAVGADKSLQITDSAGKIYKYLRVRNLSESIGTVSLTASLAGIMAELEGWRAAIDKVRGRL